MCEPRKQPNATTHKVSELPVRTDRSTATTDRSFDSDFRTGSASPRTGSGDRWAGTCAPRDTRHASVSPLPNYPRRAKRATLVGVGLRASSFTFRMFCLAEIFDVLLCDGWLQWLRGIRAMGLFGLELDELM